MDHVEKQQEQVEKLVSTIKERKEKLRAFYNAPIFNKAIKSVYKIEISEVKVR